MPTQATEEYFNRGGWGHDGTEWRKLPILWGYHDRYAENFGIVVAGTNVILYSDDVSTGYVYVLEGLSVRNITSGSYNVSAYLRADDTRTIFMLDALNVAQWRVSFVIGRWTMKAGDSIAVNVVNVTIGDTIEAAAWGYKIKVT